MHQRSLEALTVVPVEAFSPKPLNDVQKRLQAVLDYWGPNGEQWISGISFEDAPGYHPRCAVNASKAVCGLNEQAHDEVCAAMELAAKEAGYVFVMQYSDSSFANARKMVLRAIELAA